MFIDSSVLPAKCYCICKVLPNLTTDSPRKTKGVLLHFVEEHSGVAMHVPLREGSFVLPDGYLYDIKDFRFWDLSFREKPLKLIFGLGTGF